MEIYFLQQIEKLGYCAYDVYCVHINTLNNPKQLGNFVISSYPIRFVKKYVEAGFVANCIGLAKAGKSFMPFNYIQYLEKQANNQAAVWQLRLFRINNIHHAWLIPLNEVQTVKGVTLYMQGKNEVKDQFNSTKPIVQLISTYFYESLISFDPSTDQMKMLKNDRTYTLLSHREIECLSWSAQGKTSEIIGKILSISENTVRFHMKNIFRKLDVSSRPQAISKATNLNLLNTTYPNG
ncbi:MAG: autoinducer binding domain-containing protein [Alcanivoracaceae bacterium]|nr:autoinducer binding domain-containing protein [Alcanivoracaceae bacterium]